MESRRRTVSIRTLGCSKNIVDSEELMAQLNKSHLRLGQEHERADAAIINTCGFIEAAKKESIDSIVEAVDQKKAGAVGKVVVMGCLSERFAGELRREIPEVDVFLGAGRIEDAVRAAGGEYKYELLGERMLTTPAHFAY